jgi:hypothetical protein
MLNTCSTVTPGRLPHHRDGQEISSRASLMAASITSPNMRCGQRRFMGYRLALTGVSSFGTGRPPEASERAAEGFSSPLSMATTSTGFSTNWVT